MVEDLNGRRTVQGVFKHASRLEIIIVKCKPMGQAGQADVVAKNDKQYQLQAITKQRMLHVHGT